MDEKLFSPLFCKLRDNDMLDEYDDNYYWADDISQKDAVRYEDEIHEAILKERIHIEEDRGLMAYYREGDSVDEKVKSLFIDVEIHAGKLWGVANIETTAPLTPEEYDLLKDYITGQYSDGFGEGFEQREIKTSDGELYVSLWSSGSDFYIDTEQEFIRRFSIEKAPEQKPSVLAQIRDAVKDTKPTPDKEPKKTEPER